MLKEGHLVFSRAPKNGKWLANSLIDDQAWYICERRDVGWIATYAKIRDNQDRRPPNASLMERVELGWGHYLYTAKHFCDVHHHAAILAGDDESLKGYVRRYLIEAV